MDKNIRIEVDGFRAIHHAEIALNGITVIAGINGCGKSTLSKLLYSVFTQVENLEQLYVASFFNQVFPVLEIYNQIIDAYKPEGFSPAYIGSTTPEAFSDNLSRLMYSIGEALEINDDKSKRIIGIIKHNTQIEVRGKEDLNGIITICKNAYSEYVNKIKERPAVELISAVASNFSDTEIAEKVSVAEYGFEFFNQKIKSVPIIHSVHNTTYIATPMALEQLGGPLFMNTPKSHMSSSYDSDIAKELSDIMKGETEYSNEQKRFLYKRKDGQTFPLFESATGIKSFAFLQLLLKSGAVNDRSLIIIDEPEAHLHPQWIVEYARVLVELCKKTRAKFFIATHSTDMVSALRYISEKERTLEDLSFYCAGPFDEDAYTFDYHYLGVDIEPIFESFNKSIELIDKYGEDNQEL